MAVLNRRVDTMSAVEDPSELLAAEARQLAAEMEGNAARRVDLAYQLVNGRARIAALNQELAVERQRLEACVRSLASGSSSGPLQRALTRVLPPLLFFVAGMVAFAVLTFLLSIANPRSAGDSGRDVTMSGR